MYKKSLNDLQTQQKTTCEKAKKIWRGIEVVITGLTRNQLGSNPTWVRIPPSLPCETEKVQTDFFLFHNDICSDEQVILLRNEILFEYMVLSKARVHIFHIIRESESSYIIKKNNIANEHNKVFSLQ